MGKQYSSYQENPGKDLYVLAESMGNFTPIKLNSNKEAKTEKLPILRDNFQLNTEETFFRAQPINYHPEIQRTSNGSFPFLVGSQYSNNSAEWPMKESNNYRNFEGAYSSSTAPLPLSSSFIPSSALREETNISPKQMQCFFGNWELIHNKETQVLEQIKALFSGANSFERSEFNSRSKQLLEELHFISSSKSRIWSLLNDTEETQPEFVLIINFFNLSKDQSNF